VSAALTDMNTSRPYSTTATLEPVRFGEFLRDRHMISDEQWLAALADHWSAPLDGYRRLIGTTIIERGFLSAEQVEAEARVFHDDLDVIEVGDAAVHRSETTTLPGASFKVAIRA
jgi:hypothetical protein